MATTSDVPELVKCPYCGQGVAEGEIENCPSLLKLDRKVYIGSHHVPYGRGPIKMWVEIHLGLDKLNPGARMSVTHELVEEPIVLRITGETMMGGQEQGGGQNYDELLEITEPAIGWDRGQIEELRLLWPRWANNSFRPTCVHQDRDRWTCTNIARHYPNPIPPGEIVTAEPFVVIASEQKWPGSPYDCPKCGRSRWEEPGDKCPETGYRAGSGWLYEPIPANVRARLKELFS